jgi:hypothetical protein
MYNGSGMQTGVQQQQMQLAGQMQQAQQQQQQQQQAGRGLYSPALTPTAASPPAGSARSWLPSYGAMPLQQASPVAARSAFGAPAGAAAAQPAFGQGGPVLTQPTAAMTHPGQFGRPNAAAAFAGAAAQATSKIGATHGVFGRPAQPSPAGSFIQPQQQQQAGRPGASASDDSVRTTTDSLMDAPNQAAARAGGAWGPATFARPTGQAAAPPLAATAAGARSPNMSPRGAGGAAAGAPGYCGPMPFESVDANLLELAQHQREQEEKERQQQQGGWQQVRWAEGSL